MLIIVKLFMFDEIEKEFFEDFCKMFVYCCGFIYRWEI